MTVNKYLASEPKGNQKWSAGIRSGVEVSKDREKRLSGFKGIKVVPDRYGPVIN